MASSSLAGVAPPHPWVRTYRNLVVGPARVPILRVENGLSRKLANFTDVSIAAGDDWPAPEHPYRHV